MLKRRTEELANLTTPHLADGCIRTNVPVRCAPTGLKPLIAGTACFGRVRPVRHVGSIDVFLEVLQDEAKGEVLVIDNAGRVDEACIGDIIALEAKSAGVAGIIIWGLHRDSKELSAMGFPIFSLGALPTGPQRLHTRPPDMFDRAMIGMHVVTASDIVIADDNGVLFLPENRLDEIVAAAVAYRETEAKQLKAMQSGRSYRSQVRFSDYLVKRSRDASYGFRQHLKDIEAAGEV